MLLYYEPRSTLFYHKIFYQLSTICRDLKNIMNPYINEKNVKIKKDKHDFVTNDHHTCHSFWLLCAKAKKLYEEWNKVSVLETERKIDFSENRLMALDAVC